MIKRCSQTAAALLFALLLAFGSAVGARAQGVTTGAISGTVTNAAGAPVANATVTARNTATGASRAARTDASGRYFIPNLLPGTAYSVSAGIIGQATQQRSGLRVVLSQTTTVDFRLADQAVALEGLTVRAQNNPELSRSRTGAATTLSSETVTDIPKLDRSFNEVAAASPYVVTTPGQGLSIAGSNNRYNNIQIDGATTSDIFGLGSSGVPGGQGTSSKPVPIDAIDQFQVLVTPFDVRQTNFTGGLINAVTKSGTNRFRGSGFFTFRDEGLVQGDTLRGFGRNFTPPNAFYTRQFGATFGGPIIRDRLHFFFAGEVEQSERPNTFDLTSDVNTIRVLPSRVDSVIAIAQRYGVDPGNAGQFTEEERLGTFLGRLDLRINGSNRLVLRHNSSPKWRDDEGLARGGTNYDLSSYNFYYRTMNNSSVLQLFSDIGSRISNELQVNYQTIVDRPTPNVRYANVTVSTSDIFPGRTTPTTGNIRFGSEPSRHANELDQNILQVTNNLTFDAGAHRLTAGVGLDYYKFRNLFLQGALGAYTFLNVDSLRVGRANTYSVNVPLRDDVAARFDVVQPGVYLQDVWSVTENLDLTLGLRADIPRFLDEPTRNELFLTSFGVDNSEMPGSTVLFSPRFGFNWQAGGESTTQVRGGVGVFTGRPPFVWLSNAFSNTGRDFVTLTCRRTATNNNVPAFNPLNAPSTCADGRSAALSGAQLVNYTDADFKYPQELKATLGLDRELPFGITGTAEMIVSRGLNALVTREVNLAGPVTTNSAASTQGLGPREIYGRSQAESTNRFAFNPVRRDTTFRNVVELTNESHTSAFLGLVQLSRRFGRDYTLQAAYTYTDAQEPISQTSSTATSNIGFHPIGERINDFSLARSAFVRPHKVTFVGTANLFPRYGGTELSAIYVGQSGRPYTYTYDGDVNGDGYESDAPGVGGRNNDLVYIPENLDEVTFASAEDRRLFSELVDMEPCLRESRGRILERNTCTGPWVNRLDATIRQGLPGRRLGGLKLEANIFNLPNLLNRRWGLQQGPSNNTVTLLDYAGRTGNTASGAPIFSYDGFTENIGATNQRRAVKPYTTFFESRYQIQIGVRADF